jgi:hypothetical protein
VLLVYQDVAAHAVAGNGRYNENGGALLDVPGPPERLACGEIRGIPLRSFREASRRDIVWMPTICPCRTAGSSGERAFSGAPIVRICLRMAAIRIKNWTCMMGVARLACLARWHAFSAEESLNL